MTGSLPLSPIKPNNTASHGSEPRESPESARLATQAAEEKFAFLIDAVKDYGIFLLDPNGVIQSWNSGAERIKGYTAAEAIGRHFSMFYPPEAIASRHPEYELELAIRNGRYEEEGWRLRKDGTRFWANVIITCLRDDSQKVIGFAKVTRDLTERKEAEERLRRSEERARRMFEGVKDYAMILLHPDGTVASWNEGARRIKGYEPAEIIGRSFKVFYSEQDVEMGKCEYELREATETGRFEDEGWRVRKDGTKFWASVLITAIRDDQGELIGFSKVTRDMTDRKRADDLLKMAYANLEKRVAQRTNELTEANRSLREAIQVRDEFLSIASHELRTPLTPLKIQAQSLIHTIRKKGLASLSEERLERIAVACDKAVSRLSGLIDNLLDVSRINSGRMELNHEPVELTALARDLIDRYRAEIVSAGCEVTLHAPAPVVSELDRIRIEQVLLNLLTNALKYGARGPVRISVEADNGRARVVFQDAGVGIAEADFGRVFGRFERVGDNHGVSGMGLGLYITRQIVESHGGRISVESRLGQGSTFSVELPLRKTPSG